MRGRIGAQGSSCRKEGNGEERRVPGAQSGSEGLGYQQRVVTRMGKGECWLSWGNQW